MFGILPIPIYDPKQEIKYLNQSMCLFRPGDILLWKSIDRSEHDAIVADVSAGRYEPRMANVDFSLAAFQKDIDGTNAKLIGALNGN